MHMLTLITYNLKSLPCELFRQCLRKYHRLGGIDHAIGIKMGQRRSLTTIYVGWYVYVSYT